MKSIILAIALICAVYSDIPLPCTYQDSGYVYSLAGFNGWINLTTVDGNHTSSNWFINPCPDIVYGDANPCNDLGYAAVCKVSDGILSVRGLSEGALWSAYSVNGNQEGVETTFASNETCLDGFYKTDIIYGCNSNGDTLINSTRISDNGCLLTITITTAWACPNVHEIPYPTLITTWSQTGTSGFGIPIFPVILVFILAVCCCCCCAARRRRCHQKKIAMQQFSNVAFQPIPGAQSKPSAATAPFNPYVSQPQYFYYYPTQQAPQQVQLEEIPSKSDEAIAKELQAQFDLESRV